MKKYLLSFSLLSFLLVPYVYAAPIFTSPVLGEAYKQVNIRIDQKTSRITLDTEAKKTIEQKKEQLSETLVAIDKAFRTHNKAELSKQAKIFRDGWKETLAFIGNLEKTNNSVQTLRENTQQIAGSTEIIGTSTEITYYADSFEWGRTANGNTFSQGYFSAAKCEIPFNTLLQVGKGVNSVIVKANDRPNCSRYPNVTDLSRTAFATIGNISSGRLQWVLNTLGTVPKDYIKKYLETDIFQALGITLDDRLPNTYLKNETLRITGKELLWKDYTILYLRSPSGKDITLGSKKGWDGRFEHTYPLEETGTYEMVVASGMGFNTSTFVKIIVLEDSVFSGKKYITNIKTPQKLEKLDIKRGELPDLTSVYLFHFPSRDFYTITIANEKGTFRYRGFQDIAIRSDALKSLDMNTPVTVEVLSEESSTPFSHDTFTAPVSIFNKTMILVPGYKEEKNENIVVQEEDGNLLINGIISKGKNVKGDIILTLPDGNIEKYSFDPSSIDTDGYLKREKVFTKTIPLKQTGFYLVEVNYDNGFAAYNGPITYGDFLPVYPNDYDGLVKTIGNNDSSIVAGESLKFVNALRAKSGKSALILDTTLNSLATIKANNMAEYSNLSHTDSFGDKISGTAKRNNIPITGSIGENIAGGNISFGALLIGLANSGGHRANMLDNWKKIGIGYAVKDWQVYYTQVFGE